MKHLLSKFGCTVLALFLVVSLFAILANNTDVNVGPQIFFAPPTNAAGEIIYMDQEIPDKLAGFGQAFESTNEKPSSAPVDGTNYSKDECTDGNHQFGVPEYVLDDMYKTIYKRADTCTVCGYYVESNWAIYIPEGATEIPAPGGENDIFLGLSEGFTP